MTLGTLGWVWEGGKGLGSARVKCTPGDTNALPSRLVYMVKCTPVGICGYGMLWHGVWPG